jgi:hypothetical protein
MILVSAVRLAMVPLRHRKASVTPGWTSVLLTGRSEAQLHGLARDRVAVHVEAAVTVIVEIAEPLAITPDAGAADGSRQDIADGGRVGDDTPPSAAVRRRPGSRRG